MSVVFSPRPPGKNVNVSKQSPLREFLKLLVGISLTLTAAYILLGLIVTITVPLIPFSVERRIGTLINAGIEKKIPLNKEEKRVQMILDTLLSRVNDNVFDIRISVASYPTVNAVALPGGHIIVFEGLLDRITSDRQLAFVIGHEIGHFVNRDHLKALGRGLIPLLIAIAFGNQDWLSNAAINTLTLSERRFSQQQESMADSVGVELLYKAYGSADESVSFFRMLEKEDSVAEFAYFFSSHPSPKKRIAYIESLIRKKCGEAARNVN